VNPDILSFLPAGEWAEVQILNKTPGMMAGHDWALFARAKWLRHGGKPAFIKFIVRAGSHAGEHTEIVTGHDRLQRVFERLVQLKNLEQPIPLVQLMTVRLSIFENAAKPICSRVLKQN
jgi:hypothetical protein